MHWQMFNRIKPNRTEKNGSILSDLCAVTSFSCWNHTIQMRTSDDQQILTAMNALSCSCVGVCVCADFIAFHSTVFARVQGRIQSSCDFERIFETGREIQNTHTLSIEELK